MTRIVSRDFLLVGNLSKIQNYGIYRQYQNQNARKYIKLKQKLNIYRFPISRKIKSIFNLFIKNSILRFFVSIMIQVLSALETKKP